MEDFDAMMKRQPDSYLSNEIDKRFPEAQERIQQILNEYGGAFTPAMHADILAAVQSFNLHTATSILLDSGRKYRVLSVQQKIANTFADYLSHEVIQLRDHAVERDLQLFGALVSSIRAIK